MRHASRSLLGGRVGASASTPTGPRGQWPIAVVLAVAAAGLALTGWRRVPVQDALLVLAAAPGLGAVLRAVLPTRLAGLLAVRNRALDVLGLAALAAGIAVLALATPTGSS